MKLFINYYNNIINKPYSKFSLNIFFLKNIQYLHIKNLYYIHFFINLKNNFLVKHLKFNYHIFKNFIYYFIILNILIQLFIIIILI